MPITTTNQANTSAPLPGLGADAAKSKVDTCPFIEQEKTGGATRQDAIKKASGGCPFLAARDQKDVSKLIDLAKETMKQKTFGDNSFKASRDVLEEALGLNPADPKGEIHGLLGKAHFLEQRWGDAKKHLDLALARDPKNEVYLDLRDRAARNVETKVEKSTAPLKYFDGKSLLEAPVNHIREPEGWKIPKGPTGLAWLAGKIHDIGAAAAGSVLGTVVEATETAVVKASPYKTPDSPWTNWDQHKGSLLKDLIGTLKLASMRRDMNDEKTGTLSSTYPGELVGHQQPGQKKPEFTNWFRTANGSWNTSNPMEGAAGTEFQGQGRKNLETRRDRTKDADLPSVRDVSRAMLHTEGAQKKVPFLNNLAIGWIQFMTHDWISHGENMPGDVASIPLSKDDPWREKYGQDTMFVRRTQDNPTRVKDGKPQYLNESTHWWDGSQIYGSDQGTVDRLRTGADGKRLAGGKMRLEEDGTLPMNAETGVADSGFTRNWWAGLELFHTLFVKNHNWICDQLAASPECKGWSSDQLFETARLINAACMAKIHTVEWTPAVLPNKKLNNGMWANWSGLVETYAKPASKRKTHSFLDVYHPVLGGLVGGKTDNHGQPFGFSEFFVAVYRLHAGLPAALELEGGKKVPTDATRGAGARKLVKEEGLANLVKSFGYQHMTALVNNNYDGPMKEMSIDGQAAVDLGALDIYRDRERGVPPYNEFRRQMGLNPIKSFADLFPNPSDPESKKTIAKLEKLYGKGAEGVEKMDLLVGTLTEGRRPEFFGFGETLFQVFIQMASRRLEADPFYTERFDAQHYTKVGMDIIDQCTLKGVITQHVPELAKTGLAGVNNGFEPWGTTAATHPEEHPLTVNGEKYK